MPEATFNDWTERLKVYNEYVKALGEFKLKTAQSEVQYAQAANQWATVRAKQIVIQQLQRDLETFKKAVFKNKQEVEKIQEKDKAARLLLRGNSIESANFSKAWAGYVFFESPAMIQAGERLFRIRVVAGARTESNFVSTKPLRAVIPAPQEIENALQLMQWLRDRRYIPAGGSKAQLCVVKLFQEINSVATKSLEELSNRLKAIKSESYQAWNYNAILGVSGNPTAKKIEETGAS